MLYRIFIILTILTSKSCPQQPDFNYYEEGIASYYHDALEGNLTANGEVFTQDKLTAAHRTLPFGTRVLVHRPEVDKSIWVTINDRGPFNYKRIIDLSRSAADSLGMVHDGISDVIIKARVADSHSNVGDD
ncbi:MAG: septal ring lytic transglycosylase RlpA family protein [Saprospiraceae bacterium]|nr:septal ring lytic transglycosylase RlpA family protein [Saprospiraceae bacterium]